MYARREWLTKRVAALRAAEKAPRQYGRRSLQVWRIYGTPGAAKGTRYRMYGADTVTLPDVTVPAPGATAPVTPVAALAAFSAVVGMALLAIYYTHEPENYPARRYWYRWG